MKFLIFFIGLLNLFACTNYHDDHIKLKQQKLLKLPSSFQIENKRTALALSADSFQHQFVYTEIPPPPFILYQRMSDLFRLQVFQDNAWLAINDRLYILWPALLAFFEENSLDVLSTNMESGEVSLSSSSFDSWAGKAVSSTKSSIKLKITFGLYFDSSEIRFDGQQIAVSDQQVFLEQFISFYSQYKQDSNEQKAIILDYKHTDQYASIFLSYCCEDIFFLNFAVNQTRTNQMIREALATLEQSGYLSIASIDPKSGEIHLLLNSKKFKQVKTKWYDFSNRTKFIRLSMENDNTVIRLLLHDSNGKLLSRALTDEFNYVLWQTLL